MANKISPYQHRDILTPMNDPWDAQSHIFVLEEHGQLRFHYTRNGSYDVLSKPPRLTSVYIRPRARTPEYGQIARIENVIAWAISLKLVV